MINNITEEQKKEIANRFYSMESVNDFVGLINFCRSVLFQEYSIVSEKEGTQKVTLFSVKNILDLANDKKKRYTTFKINKKSGGFREIHAPHGDLSVVLKCIALILNSVYHPHKNAYGFVDGKSVVDNARLHSDSNYVFNIDLKDFFPSVEIGRIINRLNYPPFNLDTEGRQKISKYIGWLTCENMMVERKINENIEIVERRVLPQGSPASPILTNIICERLDRKLTALGHQFGLRYSRYADDITFSSQHYVYHPNGDFRTKLEKIISEEYFIINPKKVRLQTRNVRQEVTGITVNEKPNVSRKYIKQLRLWLHLWETYGTDKALEIFLDRYTKDKGHSKKVTPTAEFMQNVIEGKLNYLSMVKGQDNPTYLKLKERFDKVSNPNHKIIFSHENKIINFDKVLDVLFNEGLNKAMNLYNK